MKDKNLPQLDEKNMEALLLFRQLNPAEKKAIIRFLEGLSGKKGQAQA